MGENAEIESKKNEENPIQNILQTPQLNIPSTGFNIFNQNNSSTSFSLPTTGFNIFNQTNNGNLGLPNQGNMINLFPGLPIKQVEEDEKNHHLNRWWNKIQLRSWLPGWQEATG